MFRGSPRTLWRDELVLTFFFNDTAPTEIYTLSLHDALPISRLDAAAVVRAVRLPNATWQTAVSPLVEKSRSEEHTSELQSLAYLVCRLLLEKKKKFDSNEYYLKIPEDMSRLFPDLPEAYTNS